MYRLRHPRHGRGYAERAAAWEHAVTVRLATPSDRDAIVRVAERDTRPVPAQPLLLAVCGDEVVAALSLRDGAIVADPFRPTAQIVELLRCHAGDRRAPRPLIRGLATSSPRAGAGLARGCA